MDNLWIIYGSGWWYSYPSEKYEFVNWDDDIPNIWKNKPVMFRSSPPTSHSIQMEIPPQTQTQWIS